jgi:uncharacterized tellurite resistance protein B-like protein
VISTLQTFLKRHLLPEDVLGEDEELALEVTTATLLMEVARADNRVSEAERHSVRRILEEQFRLPPEVTRQIAASAERKAEQETSLFPLTRMINRECSAEDKARIVKMLWQVTCSDGSIDDLEEHLVRKVAGLLHVPHREFIRAKLQVTGG